MECHRLLYHVRILTLIPSNAGPKLESFILAFPKGSNRKKQS